MGRRAPASFGRPGPDQPLPLDRHLDPLAVPANPGPVLLEREAIVADNATGMSAIVHRRFEERPIAVIQPGPFKGCNVQIVAKRVYEPAEPSDALRILVDRLWPRGITKEAARIDFWAKSVSPSNELRRWYQHDPAKWSEFRRRYFAELDANPEGVAELRSRLGSGKVSFVFSSKEERLNNASALREYLETHP